MPSQPKTPTVALPLEKIRPGINARTVNLDTPEGQEFVASIKRYGVLVPVLVRPIREPDKLKRTHELVAGFRRYFAARDLKLKTIPVVVRDLTDSQAAELNLVENLQRLDLSPLEEAWGLKQLRDTHRLTIEQIAQRVGKSRTRIYDLLSLAKLTPTAAKALHERRLDLSAAIEVARYDAAVQDQAVEEFIKSNAGHRTYLRGLREQFDSEQDRLRRYQKAVDEARQRGIPVLIDKESRRLYPHNWASDPARSSGYVGVDQCCYDDPKRRTFGKLLGKARVPLALAKRGDGEPVYVLKLADARPHLDKILPPKPGKDAAASGPAKRTKVDAASEKRAREINTITDQRVLAALEKCVTPANALTVLAEALRRLDYSSEAVTAPLTIEKLATHAIAIIVSDDYAAVADDALLAACGVDRAAIEKTVRAELATTDKQARS